MRTSSSDLVKKQTKQNTGAANDTLSLTQPRHVLVKTNPTPLQFHTPVQMPTSNANGTYNDPSLNFSSIAAPLVLVNSASTNANTICAPAVPPPDAALYPMQRPLPSLMCYVDNHLMGDLNWQNLPPNPNMFCPLCQCQQNNALFMTELLPLSPCGHRVHYKCFVWWTTQCNPARDKCPCCSVPLFKWEGITTLTVATRTGLGMENARLALPYWEEDAGVGCYTDQDEYELECKHIWNMIGNHYNNCMARYHNQASDQPRPGPVSPMPPPTIPTMEHVSAQDQHPDPADGSPNLLNMYHDIFAELLNNNRPRSKWLKYETQLGYYLFAMLVSIKLRRFVEEWTKDVVGSEGWKIFEDWRRFLQQKIMAEVRQDSSQGSMNSA